MEPQRSIAILTIASQLSLTNKTEYQIMNQINFTFTNSN